MIDRDHLIVRLASSFLGEEYSREYASQVLGIPQHDLPLPGDQIENWKLRGRVAARELEAFASGVVSELHRMESERTVRSRRSGG